MKWTDTKQPLALLTEIDVIIRHVLDDEPPGSGYRIEIIGLALFAVTSDPFDSIDAAKAAADVFVTRQIIARCTELLDLATSLNKRSAAPAPSQPKTREEIEGPWRNSYEIPPNPTGSRGIGDD